MIHQICAFVSVHVSIFSIINYNQKQSDNLMEWLFLQPLDCGSQDEADSWSTSATMLQKLTLFLEPTHLGTNSSVFDQKFLLKITIIEEGKCKRKDDVITRWSHLRLSSVNRTIQKEITLNFRQVLPESEQAIAISVFVILTVVYASIKWVIENISFNTINL